MTQALETQKALSKLRPTIVNVLSTVCLLSLSSMPVVLAETSAIVDVMPVDIQMTMETEEVDVAQNPTPSLTTVEVPVEPIVTPVVPEVAVPTMTVVEVNDASNENTPLTRGEAVQRVVDFFDLEVSHAKLLKSCFLVPDECFFAFTAMSDFDGISFDPLTLYPDVKSGNKYADAINTATILGIVRGHINIDQTPFYPNHYLTRIQALKVILGATEQLPWKEKFEMEDDYWNKQSLDKKYWVADIDPNSEDQWWYGRYAAFALDAGIIQDQKYLRPNDAITGEELTELMERAQNTVNKPVVIDVQPTEEIQPPPATSEQTLN